MRKAFAPSLFAIASLLGTTAVVVACSSDSDDSKFGDPPMPEGGDGPISSLVPEGGGPDSSEGGGGTCSVSIPASFTPTWVAPTKMTACDAGELKGYYDACLVDPGKTENDGTCTAYKAAHKDCTDCTEAVNNAGPIQWQLSRAFYTINTAGCISITQAADGGDSGCGEAYNAAVQCSRESCTECITVAKSFPKFQDCQRAAGMQGICKSLEDAKAPKCGGLNDPGSPAIPCLRSSSSEAQEPYFTRVLNIMCGPA